MPSRGGAGGTRRARSGGRSGSGTRSRNRARARPRRRRCRPWRSARRAGRGRAGSSRSVFQGELEPVAGEEAQGRPRDQAAEAAAAALADMAVAAVGHGARSPRGVVPRDELDPEQPVVARPHRRLAEIGPRLRRRPPDQVGEAAAGTGETGADRRGAGQAEGAADDAAARKAALGDRNGSVRRPATTPVSFPFHRSPRAARDRARGRLHDRRHATTNGPALHPPPTAPTPAEIKRFGCSLYRVGLRSG